MRLIVNVLLFFCLVAPAFSEVIWEQNFDDYDDWTHTQPTGSSDYSAYEGEGTIPPNFHSIRDAGSFYTDKGNNNFYIDNTNYRGASGKSLTFWIESDTRGGGGAGWSSDSILGINLSTGYNELYIQYWIKYQSGWQWDNSSTENESKNSISVTHWRGGDPFVFFSDGNQRPIADLHLVKFG